MMGDMKDDIMTQVQTLFEEQMKEALKIMQCKLTEIVKEIVTKLVSPLLQQQLKQNIMTETKSRKRIRKDFIDKNNTVESEEEVHSEEIEGGNSSGDEGTSIKKNLTVIGKRKNIKQKHSRRPCLDRARIQNYQV